MWRKFLDLLPHGQSLTEEDWQRRHRIMLWVLGLHVPALAIYGLALGYDPRTLAVVLITPVAADVLGHLLSRHRRTAAITVTFGLVYCSAALVGLSHGSIEAHFHFFVIIGFIALYQDWAPFLFNIVFTVLSHGIGSTWKQSLFFDHAAGQANPWLWSLIHGIAVLFACVGMVLFWRVTEDSQWDKDVLTKRLAETEINRRRFTSDLLTNLARRNQSLLHRQLDIINQLEESEEDPDALAELFALDHIATRVRRNAENLLVLSGEQPPRTWSEPVALRDVLRAAIAETENLERVVFVVDEQSAVVGHTVTDLTHLLAELTENAVRFSPPDTTVTIRSRPDRARPGGRAVTIEDWGLGMTPEQIDEANALLAKPLDIDLSISQRLGFHVVARLAARHGIKVTLSVTPGSGTTALIMLPPSLFASQLPAPVGPSGALGAMGAPETFGAGTFGAGTFGAGTFGAETLGAGTFEPGTAAASEDAVRRHIDGRPPPSRIVPLEQVSAPSMPCPPDRSEWSGWWDPAVATSMPAFDPTPAAVNGSAMAIATPPHRVSTPSPHAPPPHPEAPQPESSQPPSSQPQSLHPQSLHPQSPQAGASTDYAEPSRSRPRPSPSPMARPTVIEGGPVPAPRPIASPAAGGLRRRVPQSHLSAQLRTPEPEPAVHGRVGQERTTAETAAALSRYQASRAAAQAAAEKGNP